jgi:ABC-type transport system involved in multi-copper enzyme maturation permease subunit
MSDRHQARPAATSEPQAATGPLLAVAVESGEPGAPPRQHPGAVQSVNSNPDGRRRRKAGGQSDLFKSPLGPVFANEWLTTSRRWQVYAGRALFVGVLLLGLSSVWVSRTTEQTLPPIQAMAEVGEGFYSAIVFTQLSLVLLTAPAATAGVICQDRSSGRLGQLLGTDLSDSEIVLGKLAARLVPVLGLVCCALPALAICVLMGGVDPVALTGAFFITVCIAVFGCTLALAFSVWASKPYEVLLATYAVFMVWLLAIPSWDLLAHLWRFPSSPDWTIWSHPFYLAFAPYAQPGKVGVLDYLAFCAAMLISSAALLALVIRRMRAASALEAGRSASRPPRRPLLGVWIGGAEIGVRSARVLDNNPVLWYETHRKQHTPWIRALIGLYLLLAIESTLLACVDMLWMAPTVPGWLSANVVAFTVVIGLPLLLLSATTALVEERARGSLDVLLATPVATRSIVLAKWWGAFRELPRVIVLPLLVAGILASVYESWRSLAWLVAYVLAAAAFWTSIGLALSTWVPRLGRAVSAAVAFYAVVALGWPVLIRTMFWGPLGVGPAAISPFYGLFDLTRGLQFPGDFDHVFIWFRCWIAGQAVVAAGLLLATLATFDRCLGRIPSRGLRRQARRTDLLSETCPR